MFICQPMENRLKDKHRKEMNRFELKEYHRPFMTVESFVTSEFVAACVDGATLASGRFCFDLNNNGKYDTSPNEASSIGGEYLGGTYFTDFYAGDFVIEEQGRYYYQGGKAYLFLGTNFDFNGTYSYNSDEFAPLYYVNAVFKEHNDPGVVHRVPVYYIGPGKSGGVTNAS